MQLVLIFLLLGFSEKVFQGGIEVWAMPAKHSTVTIQ